MINLETYLDHRLWIAIQSSYEKESFTGAIMDSIYFLSDLIRDKSGLDLDGVALIGQAFGGNSPRLKLGNLETESGRNIQSGIEQLLRGLYQAVRNPRSHDKYNDKREDADAIIVFVDYLARVIDQSRARFVMADYLDRVFDKNFVEKERYAELLGDEIPPKNRLEVMLQVLSNKEKGEGKKLKFFVKALMGRLADDEQATIYQAISDEFKTTNSESTIRVIIQIFPSNMIQMLEESARLRIENKLIQSIAEGRYDSRNQKCKSGALGTWATEIGQYFLLKEELVSRIITKLSSEDQDQHDYVMTYFWRELVNLQNPPSERLVRIIKNKLKAGNRTFYDQLKIEELGSGTEWVVPFAQEMNAFKPNEAFDAEPDDLPF